MKEETFAYPDATSPKQLRQSVYLVASSLSQRAVQINFPIQRNELVPCVQVLFGVVAQVPVCLLELSHLISACCLF